MRKIPSDAIDPLPLPNKILELPGQTRKRYTGSKRLPL
jgi:hypothetical protein